MTPIRHERIITGTIGSLSIDGQPIIDSAQIGKGDLPEDGSSLIHVLVVTPVLFSYMKERALKKGKLEMSKMAGWMKES